MNSVLKNLLRPAFYFFEYHKVRLLYRLKPNKIRSSKDIPIIINNFNRLTFLRQLISSLEKRDLKNIYILDNDSTYPPLLEYYKTIPYEIIYLRKNTGHLALWKTNVYKRFYRDFYIYTDSDVEIADKCPEDFLQVFLDEMNRNRKIDKIGLGLRITDLPDCFRNKEEVIKWESQFFTTPVNDMFYIANVDTTFALYRPGITHGANKYLLMYRSKFPYEIKHLPWYLDTQNLSDEEKYYISTAKTSSHWTKEISKQCLPTPK